MSYYMLFEFMKFFWWIGCCSNLIQLTTVGWCTKFISFPEEAAINLTEKPLP